MATHGMTIAKASKDDFEKVYNLLSPMEELFNSKWCNEEEWTEWDDGDEDKQELLAIRKEIAEDEYCEEDQESCLAWRPDLERAIDNMMLGE